VEKPLAFHEVSAERWPDFERLFEAKGSPKYCWCMAWRASSAEARNPGAASRKAAMKERVCAGVPVGLLAYAGGEPVAWCSIAPRSTYRRLVSDQTPDEGIWSIACFFVVRRLRRTGISRQLIDAAVRHARSHGAKMVEAYPVDAASPSYRFMGFVPVFAQAGFAEAGREGTRRHVMRLGLSSTRRSKQ
jgi:GNAT superfamily N-acetyltransferase